MHQLAVGFIMKTGELKHSQQFHMTMIFDVIKIIEIEAVFLYNAFLLWKLCNWLSQRGVIHILYVV